MPSVLRGPRQRLPSQAGTSLQPPAATLEPKAAPAVLRRRLLRRSVPGLLAALHRPPRPAAVRRMAHNISQTPSTTSLPCSLRPAHKLALTSRALSPAAVGAQPPLTTTTTTLSGSSFCDIIRHLQRPTSSPPHRLPQSPATQVSPCSKVRGPILTADSSSFFDARVAHELQHV